tara:strand:+ start:24 stop:452 length:429 start_codon:yes stop_codon:yes gene_type:complete
MNFAKTALDLFYKTFGRRILKTAADNKWVTNMIQKLKSKASTQKIADKIRQDMKKPGEGFKSTTIPKELNKFKPEIVPKKPKTLGDALKTGTHTKVPTPKGLKPPSLKKSNVIPFPNPKKPPTLKADGGRIDKALPGRSRDI